MSALRIGADGSPEGRDRLWQLLNVVLIGGAVAATVLAIGVIVGLFIWLYTLPPIETERPTPRNPPPRRAAPPPQASETGPAAAPSPLASGAAAAVPAAVAAAEPAPPGAAEAEPVPTGDTPRNRRAARRVARTPRDPGTSPR
ncbi:MAG: hypothetical protein U0587_07170 [Candidatus Binatia bacterium]